MSARKGGLGRGLDALIPQSVIPNEIKTSMSMPTCSMSSQTLPSQIADSGISNDTSVSTFNSFSNFINNFGVKIFIYYFF
jgi:hypothetical protein